MQRMYDALAGANSTLERDVISLLLATLDPQALLDAGRLADYEVALRFACIRRAFTTLRDSFCLCR